MPLRYRQILRAVVFIQISIVAWDTLALLEPYGLRRTHQDGIYYLFMANRLLQGELPYDFPHRCELPLEYRWHHEWPLGYPLLVASASWISGAPPFYASRWANLALYLLGYGLLLWAFRPWAEWLFLTLFSPNVTWVVGFAISEGPYLTGWIACVIMVLQLLRSGNWGWAVGLAAGLTGIFLLRYNALAVGAAAGLMGLWYFWKGQRRVGGLLVGAAAMQGIFAGLYFAWNAYQDPFGYTGLRMYPPMPMQDGWVEWLVGGARFGRYAVLIGLTALLVYLWRRRSPTYSLNFPTGLVLFLGATAVFHALGYTSSMLQARIGILDERHLFPILLPVLWLAWWSLGQSLSPKLVVVMAFGLVAWQVRNTVSHQRRAAEEGKLFPYAHVEQVRQAYDTLPPRSCVILPNIAYTLVAKRSDLCFPDPYLGYGFLTCQRCEHVYVDCGAVEARVQMGLSHLPYGVVWRACAEPARGVVDLRRYSCEKSP